MDENNSNIKCDRKTFLSMPINSLPSPSVNMDYSEDSDDIPEDIEVEPEYTDTGDEMVLATMRRPTSIPLISQGRTFTESGYYGRSSDALTTFREKNDVEEKTGAMTARRTPIPLTSVRRKDSSESEAPSSSSCKFLTSIGKETSQVGMDFPMETVMTSTLRRSTVRLPTLARNNSESLNANDTSDAAAGLLNTHGEVPGRRALEADPVESTGGQSDERDGQLPDYCSTVAANENTSDAINETSRKPKIFSLKTAYVSSTRDEHVRPFRELLDVVQDESKLREAIQAQEAANAEFIVEKLTLKFPSTEVCSDVIIFQDYVVLSTETSLRKMDLDPCKEVCKLPLAGAGRMCKVRNTDHTFAVIQAPNHVAVVRSEAELTIVYSLVLKTHVYTNICHIDTLVNTRSAHFKMDPVYVFAMSYSANEKGKYVDKIDLIKAKKERSGSRGQWLRYDVQFHDAKSRLTFQGVNGIFGMASCKYGTLLIACWYRIVCVNIYRNKILWNVAYKTSPSDVCCEGPLVVICLKDAGRIELRESDGKYLYNNVFRATGKQRPHRVAIHKNMLFMKIFNETTWKAVTVPCDIKAYTIASNNK